jgi:hypothetical protein
MSVSYFGCDESLSLQIQNYLRFSEAEIIEVKSPISAAEIDIYTLFAGPDLRILPVASVAEYRQLDLGKLQDQQHLAVLAVSKHDGALG